jgi:hypothetical protein
MEIEYGVCVEQVIWRDNSKEENREVHRRKEEKSRKVEKVETTYT